MEKSVLIFGKSALIVVIYVLNLSFKMQFLRVSWRKNLRFFSAGSFFLVLYIIAYQSALISRKLSCLKNCLVTRLIMFKTLHKKWSFLLRISSVNCNQIRSLKSAHCCLSTGSKSPNTIPFCEFLKNFSISKDVLGSGGSRILF